MVRGPLLVVARLSAPGLRSSEALAGGADLVGMARPLIADPDLPRKLFEGRRDEIRPCVACNEDCRTFDPLLLCTVNPDLAPPGEPRRPAAPLELARDLERLAGGRVAVVGAGPAGLECALSLAREGVREVVVFEAADHIGGQLAIAAAAPQPLGLGAAAGLLRARAPPRGRRAPPRSAGAGAGRLRCGRPGHRRRGDRAGGRTGVVGRHRGGPQALRGAAHVIVVDDGFGWWPAINVVELALAAGAGRVTLVTPGTAFAGGIPAESRVQLVQRLAGAGELQVVPLASATEITAAGVTLVDERLAPSAPPRGRPRRRRRRAPPARDTAVRRAARARRRRRDRAPPGSARDRGGARRRRADRGGGPRCHSSADLRLQGRHAGWWRSVPSSSSNVLPLSARHVSHRTRILN